MKNKVEEVFGLKCSVISSGIYIWVKDKNKFKEIIKDFIHPDLLYKI